MYAIVFDNSEIAIPVLGSRIHASEALLGAWRCKMQTMMRFPAVQILKSPVANVMGVFLWHLYNILLTAQDPAM